MMRALSAAGAVQTMARASLVSVVLLLVVVAPAAAEPTPFTGAEVAYERSLGDVRLHEIPVARPRRGGSFTQPREVEAVTGRRRNITWTHPRGVSPAEVYEHLRAQLPDEAWFECESRACGASSFWAHSQFEVAYLHGVDGSQFYAAVPEALDEGYRVNLLYVVQRGTREVLAHWEEILVEGELPR